MTRKTLFVFALIIFNWSFAQQPQPPVEPKFMSGGVSRFYQFITDEIDFSKVAEEKTMQVTFYLDPSGLMNDIKTSEFKNQGASDEIIRVLKKTPKWDVSNQIHSFSLIRYKIKLLFRDKKVLGETQVSWDSKNDAADKENPTFDNVKPITQDENDSIYNVAGIEQKPEFSGGLKEFYTYIGQNFKVPDVKGLTGKIYTTFVIEKDGSLTGIKVLRDIGYGTGDEAIRVLKSSPKWIPAEQNGKKVRVLFSLPITIQLR